MLTATLLVAIVGAGGPADALLARVDAASNAARDVHLTMDLVTTDADGEVARRGLELWQKGDDKRLIRFSAPAKLAGTAILVRDAERVYVYVPSYGRARRVAGKALGEGFVGTDFAIEDLARTGLARDWKPALRGGVGARGLALTPLPGKELASARIELTVRPEDDLPALIEHYDAEGKVIRRIRFDDVRQVPNAAGGGTAIAHAVTVEDVREGRTTKATVTSAELDRGVPDELFTLNRLKP